MPSQQSTTLAPQYATLPIAVAFVEPDLATNVIAAQHAGDLAYAFAQRAGASLVDQAIAYHVAFAETMGDMGTPMPCPCDLCLIEAEPAGAITVEEELARR